MKYEIYKNNEYTIYQAIKNLLPNYLITPAGITDFGSFLFRDILKQLELDYVEPLSYDLLQT